MDSRSHLRVEVTPVRRQSAEGTAPAIDAARSGRSYLRRRSLLVAGELERCHDPFLVEPAQQPSRAFRPDTGHAAADDREADRFAAAPGVRRPEQRRRAVAARVVRDIQHEARFHPLGRQVVFDLVELFHQLHEPSINCDPVAKVEQKGALSKSELREFFREMLLIRRFEEKVEERFRAGELPGFLHVAIGQEAVAVGVCRALEEGDIIASTHRAHGHTLAKGRRRTS